MRSPIPKREDPWNRVVRNRLLSLAGKREMTARACRLIWYSPLVSVSGFVGRRCSSSFVHCFAPILPSPGSRTTSVLIRNSGIRTLSLSHSLQLGAQLLSMKFQLHVAPVDFVELHIVCLTICNDERRVISKLSTEQTAISDVIFYRDTRVRFVLFACVCARMTVNLIQIV